MEINRPIFTAIALFIILGFGFFVFLPQYKEFKKFQRGIAILEAELRGKSKYFADLAQLKETLKGYEESLKKVETALPKEFDLDSFIYFIQDKSNENGLLFQGAIFAGTSQVAKEGAVRESIVNISVFGSYSALRNFLSSLEKSSRLIEVENISISSAGQFQEVFSVSLPLKVYSY